MAHRHCIFVITLISVYFIFTHSIRQTRIAKGRESKGYPWMGQFVALGPGNEILQSCGATLIHPQWALTAAHCLYPKNRNEPISELKNIQIKFGSIHYNSGTPFSISKAIVNPDYDVLQLGYENDVLILKLTSEVPETVGEPIILSDDILPFLPGDVGLVPGWGTDDSGKQNPVLLEAELPLGCPPLAVPWGYICAAPDPDDAPYVCKGDDGGPVVVKDQQGRQVQLAIVSYHLYRETCKSYTFFVNVPFHFDWIHAQIAKN